MQDNFPAPDEMRATLEARRDLGPEYEYALIESFVEKVEASISSRVRAEVDTRLGPPPNPYAAMPPPYAPPPPPPRANHDGLWTALGSMAMSIPLTAIAGHVAGVYGLFLTWIGIVIVNVAAAASRRR